uniref:Uncharacterized protein LOC100177270 n=1 Tax=Phallusia mammillata TaxID=59560 RepID=A0A6F9DGV3_9ASCI|nr:uncharacterized protein LOC100177270 [Phallusia mammillata]
MKVILAGYPKTGTKTMAAVFTMLGYNNYDYLENYFYLHKEWLKIFDGSATNEDIRKMFGDVDALTDTPVCLYWEELHQAFPEAKIILTTRDEDSWYKSLMKQLESANSNFLLWMVCVVSPQSILRLSYNYHTSGRFFGDLSGWPSCRLRPYHEKVQRALYRQHNYSVMKKAPKDKLLVYNVSEGWEPLCEFLGVEIPDKPFPHKNKDAALIKEMTENNKVMQRIILEGVISLSVVTVLVGYAGYRFCESDTCSKLVSWVSENVNLFRKGDSI